MTIDALIDKQDTFEIVRDAIAQILADEVAAQQALATAAGKDATLWDMGVFTERFNPWEMMRDQPSAVPVVHVWYDRSNFQMGASNVVEKQQVEASFNIDLIARGTAEDIVGAGHVPGDKDAIFNVQRAARLTRNILMADLYTYLGLRGTVGRRWISSIESFQPDQGEHGTPRVAGMRISLSVIFNEFSPQYTPETLEGVSVSIQRDIDGKVLAKMEFPE